MQEHTLKLLEYDKILEKVAAFAVSDRAKAEVLSLTPDFNFETVCRNLETTSQAILLRDKYLTKPVYDLDDVLSITEKAAIGITLSPADFLKIAKLLRCAQSAKRAVLSCGDDVILIKEYVEFLTPNMSLVKQIDETIAGDEEIRDNASELLRTTRRKLISLHNKLHDKLNAYTHSSDNEKYLQDNIITVRDGRFVIPVKTEYRGSVPGLIHDRSASGSTLYIEPFPIVEMNNELRALKAVERDEIERVLKNLTVDVAAEKTSIDTAYHQLTALDVVFAKAAFSSESAGSKATFNKKGIVDMKNCRHPLIDSDKVVPIDVKFGKEYNFLIITGPNTGGKTVSLKTVGLFCLMAYSGIYVPCDKEVDIAVYDNIFCDIGDEQSIAQSLSTFSSHMTNIAKIADSVTPDSLVLLDEIGVGTDPVEGAALAVGILKYFELMNCRGIITTHYSELKEYALVSDKLMNACMQFDEDTLSPTYRLIIGLPGVSNALDIAAKLGVNNYIVGKAKESLNEEKIQFERVLQNAEQVKTRAIAELDEIRALKADLLVSRQKEDETLAAINSKLAQINNNAKLETQKIIRRASQQAEELIEEIKQQLKIADDKALLEAKRLQKKLDALQYENESGFVEREYQPLSREQAKIGTSVIIKSLNLSGTIVSAEDRKGLFGVTSGSMNLKLPLSDLAQTVQPKIKTRAAAKNTKKAPRESDDNTDEIVPIEEVRVLGMTVSEAIAIIEPRIMTASQQTPIPILKIVHGKGTGALGRGIQNYCKTCPAVKSYRYGRYGEGESGVTFIEIK